MRAALFFATSLFFVTSLRPAVPLSAQAATVTLTGQISDSLCKAKHEEAAEGQGKMADRECTLSCVRGGSKFVLLVDGKVIAIANQDHKDLTTYAGQVVTVQGDRKGDAITVAHIEPAKP
ncbi:MAG TPA: hypothetical protein VGY48_10110 [Vicinamibacterales bacterium]|jgi:hypothetical protein|nr:hypothetical protein [Vicinamibacterales bacterium]